jgi:phenylpropionate dioxygenase-like ring-hydroxylating dioxygenase large terminal subunit
MNLKDFWYIIAESRELKSGRVLARTVLSENLAVFRNEQGKAIALQDRCRHRAAPLSKGTVVGGALVCPYHGWKYSTLGQVEAVPSEGENFRKVASRCTPSYETREQDGYIYVRLNRNVTTEVEPFRMRRHGEKGWRTVRVINFFENSVTNCIENFIDIPHTVYVHPGIFRTERRQPIDVSISRKNGSVRAEYRNENTNLGWFSRFLNPSGHEITHSDEFFMPNVSCVEYGLSPSRHLIITSQAIPLEEGQTLVYTDVTYNYGIWTRLAAPFIRWYAQAIINQDIVALREQGQVIRKYGSEFANTPSDTIHVYVESIQREIEAGRDPALLPEKSATVRMYI